VRLFLGILTILIALPLASPASEFDWLVREFSRESGAKQTHIPLFGVMRFAVSVGHPAGASELKLALFEHTDLEPRRFSDLTDAAVGRDWKPMVRVRSRSGESTNIYAQTDGRNLRLLIASLDREEAAFVQVRIRPEELMKFVDDHAQAKK